ncbi:MAG: type II toxin-antitoxin system VapC family toxin [Candidatus Eisenbacteria sp.]|nr:type II toxin-antitoxin system VapC family toxin [Candidatus Eisenbacteria bacterium]
MIVVDTNQLAYLLIGGEKTDLARQVLLQDPEWAAPLLWRSEFRSILTQYLRKEEITLPDAVRLQRKAEQLVAGREFLVRSDRVLRLAASSDCSACDCEFVALAKQLKAPLVTWDWQVLSAFPAIAMSPGDFLDESA